jgi:hypothetical protein
MIVSVLILSAVALFIATPIAIHVFKLRKRTNDLRRTASELGFTFSPYGDMDTFEQLSAFPLLHSKASATQLSNVMRGMADGLEVKIFDYEYRTGSEESLEDKRQTVICFRSPELDVPEFTLRPKNLFHKIAAFFGYPEVVVADHPLFSKSYILRGQDGPAVRKLFHEDVLLYFERCSNFSAEGKGSQFLLYRAGKLVEWDDVRFLVQQGFEILEMFWKASSRRREELPHDFRQRFGVRVAGDVAAPLDRHPTGIRKSLE